MISRLFNQLKVGGNQYTKELHATIRGHGINFATGTPCGILSPMILDYETDAGIFHIRAINERHAVSYATGAYLGGKNPLIYMQNSGLFVSANDIGSIMIPSRTPAIFLMTYRGNEGENATQHFITGANTESILNGFRMHYEILSRDNIGVAVESCFDYMVKTGLPSVLLVKRGWTRYDKERPIEDDSGIVAGREKRYSIPLRFSNIKDIRRYDGGMHRDEAVQTILDHLSDKNPAIFSTTGLISRACYTFGDSANQFYNAGGFGHTASIGLGFALSRPEVKTVVIDGDSSLLSGFGNLHAIGNAHPKNLVHIVLDNGAYGSCSEEASSSGNAFFEETAAIQGYENIATVDSLGGLSGMLEEFLGKPGPSMIRAYMRLGGPRDLSRPLDMAGIAARFKDHFRNGK